MGLSCWHLFLCSIWCHHISTASAIRISQLSAMDVSVRSTMKGAAKCDTHCELQISVNRQGLERILCFWDIPESMPASVSTPYCLSVMCRVVDLVAVIACASGCASVTSDALDVQGATSAMNFLRG